jgi:hypothetical protein
VTDTTTASCPIGTKLVGGGAVITNTGGERGALQSSAPGSVDNTWEAVGVAVAQGDGEAHFTVTAYALCAS